MKRSDFTFPPPNESDASRNDMASICYWLGVGSIWFLLLAPVSIVLGIIALNKIKALSPTATGQFKASAFPLLPS